MAVTQKQIDDTINNCPYKKRLYDIDICRLCVYPCERVIDNGECYSLKKLLDMTNVSKSLVGFCENVVKEYEDGIT